MGYLKRLYDWVLHWAETPFGVWALFVLAFAESSFFPIPPDVLLVALVIGSVRSSPSGYPPFPSLAEPKPLLAGLKEWSLYFVKLFPWAVNHSISLTRSFWGSKASFLATICSLASLVGGIAGYGIGHFLWYANDGSFSAIARFFFSAIPGVDEQSFTVMKTGYDTWNFWIVFAAGFTPIPYKLITISAGVFNINFPIFCLASAVSRSARFFMVACLLWMFGPPVKAFIDTYFNLLCFVFLLLLLAGFTTVKLLL